MSYAPIILFVFNRPEHTKRTLTFLSQNYLAPKSDVHIFADGPKENTTDENQKKIEETRKVIREKFGFKSVSIRESEKNKGLAPSIIAGVTDIINKFGKCIVVEDDLETSPWFLTYMNDALEVYKDTPNVACIHGYVEPHKKQLPETFFLKGADCWGWGTWKRAWDKFNPDGQELLSELHNRKCERHFNFNNTYNYVGMLEDQIAGRNSSWAIRWLASAYLNDMYCLYPNETLVLNVGFDGSGTHCGEAKVTNRVLTTNRVNVVWQEPKQCEDGWNEYRKYFKKTFHPNIFYRILRKIIHLFKSL